MYPKIFASSRNCKFLPYNIEVKCSYRLAKLKCVNLRSILLNEKLFALNSLLHIVLEPLYVSAFVRFR